MSGVDNLATDLLENFNQPVSTRKSLPRMLFTNWSSIYWDIFFRFTWQDNGMVRRKKSNIPRYRADNARRRVQEAPPPAPIPKTSNPPNPYWIFMYWVKDPCYRVNSPRNKPLKEVLECRPSYLAVWDTVTRWPASVPEWPVSCCGAAGTAGLPGTGGLSNSHIASALKYQ